MNSRMISVGQWFLRRDIQDLFQVVDWDDRSGTIRVQMFDGSLDEIEEDSWQALSPEPAGPPEDSNGPLDNLDTEELDEWATEVRVEPEDYFRDDREPWESLIATETLDMDAEWAALSRRPGPVREATDSA